jgi:S1-C subfamily serine protease
VLKLDTPAGRSPLTLGQPVLGGFAVVLAADAQAAPTVRLTTVHRIARVGHTAVAVLDLAPHQVDLGAVALDADGRLIGIVASGTNGEAILVPPASIGDVIQLARSAAAEVQPLTQTPARGWLGLALQPITVPEPLAARAGQTSARMIVKITAGGPAEHGGLMVGDVLLTLNDISVTGSHSLRAFLTGDKIGCPVNARVLRDGTLFTTQLIVAPPPG